MIILKFLLYMFLIPFFMGLIYTYFCKENKNSAILALVSGYIIEFALFELITVPSTFLEISFSNLLNIWRILIFIIPLISIILNVKRVKEFIIYNLKQLKKLPLLSILVFILIGLQLFVVFRYMHIDDDDAIYVAGATTTIYTDKINMHHPSRGNLLGGWQPRYVLSPFSTYIATLSQELGLDPSTTAHTILPVVLISLMYMIYFLIAQKLFKKDKKAICIFLLLMNIIYIFGNYSNRTNFTFALFRMWQGKAVLANIMIPAIWYWYLVSSEENMKLTQMIMMFIVVLSSCLVTSMSVVLGSLIIATSALISTIKNRQISYLWKYAITCLPYVVCGVIYLILRGI